MAGRPRFIDPEQIAELTERGWGIKRIADELSVTTRTVQRWRTKLGYSGPKAPLMTEEWHVMVRELGEQGYPPVEIARIAGGSVDAVRRHYPQYNWSIQTSNEYVAMVRAVNRINPRKWRVGTPTPGRKAS